MTRQRPSPVVVEAPASSANLGPGYDIFALALESPRDRLTLRAFDSPRPSVDVSVKGSGTVPRSAERNAAGAVALKIAKDFDLRFRISIVLEKNVPIGVGLGSSAASSAAAAFAMNECFYLGLNPSGVVGYAAHGEFVCSGVEHYDNVAASTMGGFVIVRAGSTGGYTRFEPPEHLKVCLATPAVRLPERKTEYARSILPRRVDLDKVVRNTGAASTVVAGFAKKDIALIGRGMEDAIVETARSAMVPAYWELKKAAIEGGAAGVCISGAGPSVLAIVDDRKQDPARVLKAMRKTFKRAGLDSKGFVTAVGMGAHRVDQES